MSFGLRRGTLLQLMTFTSLKSLSLHLTRPSRPRDITQGFKAFLGKSSTSLEYLSFALPKEDSIFDKSKGEFHPLQLLTDGSYHFPNLKTLEMAIPLYGDIFDFPIPR